MKGICGLVLLIFITSCKINGTTQGLYGYQKKTETTYPGFILSVNDDICTKKEIKHGVTKLNGLDLAPCLSDNAKTLVYLWQPKCSADRCISPASLKNICDQIDAQLFIVAEYYDYDAMFGNLMDSEPLFGIDQQYYGTSLTKKYKAGFLKDMGVDALNSKQEHLFFYFEDGRFVSSNGDFRTSDWMRNRNIQKK